MIVCDLHKKGALTGYHVNFYTLVIFSTIPEKPQSKSNSNNKISPVSEVVIDIRSETHVSIIHALMFDVL